MGDVPESWLKPQINPNWINHQANLPYGLTVAEVIAAVQATYDFFHDINGFLI